MIHKLEIGIEVNNLSEEQYEKIRSLLEACMRTGNGLEDWELINILNPDSRIRKRIFFPSEFELPEITIERDSPSVITKINFIS